MKNQNLFKVLYLFYSIIGGATWYYGFAYGKSLLILSIICFLITEVVYFVVKRLLIKKDAEQIKEAQARKTVYGEDNPELFI